MSDLFISAIKNANLEQLIGLIKQGENVNQIEDTSGLTALSLACENNDINIVRLLIRNKADVNKSFSDRPLEIACKKGFYEIAELLINYGAAVNEISDNHTTPMHLAVENNHVELIKLLKKHGADLNLRYGSDPFSHCLL